MQPKRILLACLVAALCITPLFFLLGDTRAPEAPAPAIESVPREGELVSEDKPAEAKPAVATTPARTHAFVAKAVGTVESVMQTRRTEGVLTYSSRLYPGLGSFVESIGGLENTGGSYWMLYVNGSLSSRGISQTKVERGDRIEWRYE